MSIVLTEKKSAAAESYRSPMLVTHLRLYKTTSFYICPRGITLEREFMSYCDRCGQCLDWKCYRKAVIVK